MTKSILFNHQQCFTQNGINYHCSLDNTNILNDILYNYIDTQTERDSIINDLVKTNKSQHHGLLFTYTDKLNIKLDAQYIINHLLSKTKIDNSYLITVDSIFNIFAKKCQLLVNHDSILVETQTDISISNDSLFTNNLFDLLNV